MYGAVVLPSKTADLDVFFMHNEGYSTMCGHAIIALTKLALESGGELKDGQTQQLEINVPAGRVRAQAIVVSGLVKEVCFRNVPSFVLLRDEIIDVPGIGRVRFDVAFGGAFYAIVDATTLGLPLSAERHVQIIDCGRRIKRAIMERFPIVHPLESELSFLYGTILTAAPSKPWNHSRNVTVFADGELDRSATGSGVSARAALLHARGELKCGEAITIESVIGSTMTVRCVGEIALGTYAAVIPQVQGTAHVVGRSEFYFDPDDNLMSGFLLR